MTRPGSAPSRPKLLTLRVRVTGLRNADGKVLAALYSNSEGFPSQPDKAFKKLELTVEGTAAIGTFADLRPGTYAVSVIHDEDGDGKLNTNFIGMPKEGVGASGKASLGPPTFDGSKFELTDEKTEVQIKLRYL
jgi:uncharacterized protein (DUF2141 family)